MDKSTHITPIKRVRWRIAFYYLLSVVTLGTLPILFYWFDSLEILLYEELTDPNEADHLLIVNKATEKRSIRPIKRSTVRLLPHLPIISRLVFNYKKHFYYFSKDNKRVKSLKDKMLGCFQKNIQLVERYKRGLTPEEAQSMLELYHKNVVDVSIDSVFYLFIKELFSPFTIFQIGSLIVWMMDEYVAYALLILFMMLGSIATTIYEVRTQGFKIREMAYHESPVQVIRKEPTPKLELDTEPPPTEFFRKGSGKIMMDDNLPGDDLMIPNPEGGIRKPLLVKAPVSNNQKSAMSMSCPMNLSSLDLCIGDIVKISPSETIPADVLLISGKCLVDESILTGETVPVLKTFVDSNGRVSEINILYAGTHCLSSFSATGIVLATGFYSKKGELVRSLLFTDYTEFQFKRDSLKFIVLTTIISGLGFLWFAVYIATYKYPEYYDFEKMLIKGLEVFTVAVPPALPLCLAIGLELANHRLKQSKVFTRIIEKINEAGRVSTICFDKTGTLTENSLNLFGMIPIYGGHEDEDYKVSDRDMDEIGERYFVFDKFYHDLKDINSTNRVGDHKTLRVLTETMGCCHGLTEFNGKIVGDPMELQLFSQSNFRLPMKNISPQNSRFSNVSLSQKMSEQTESNVQEVKTNEKSLSLNTNGDDTDNIVFPDNYFVSSCRLPPNFAYTILRRLEFSSDRKRMSVVIENKESGDLRILTKGAPEVIKKLCDSSTIPFNFDDVLEEYTEQGLRVIAVAYKELLSAEEAMAQSVEMLESSLTFVGLLMFENPVKPGTTETITKLKKCDVQCRMITGDNVLTAISVGIATGIVDGSKALFTASVENGEIHWEHLENETERRSRHSSIFQTDQSGIFMSRRSSFHSGSHDHDYYIHDDGNPIIKTIYTHCEKKRCVIAMSGEAFEKFYTDNWIKSSLHRLVLANTYIYGRTSPEQKASIVAKIQLWYKHQFKENWFVAFCGDGANDCAALKKADVGLSLSETEASIAAPFNTTSPNISVVLDLFREGKASLETALQNFKYILYYSLLQFAALLALYNKAFEFCNGHYYYFDLFVFIPLSIFLCNNDSAKSLNKHFPKASLMNFEVLFEIFGQVAIGFIAMIVLVFLIGAHPATLELNQISASTETRAEQNFYAESQAYFFAITLVYCTNALLFSKGYPFKEPFYKNKMLVIWAVLSVVLLMVFTYINYLPVGEFFIRITNQAFRNVRLELSFVHMYVIFSVLFALVCWGFESYTVPRILKERAEKKLKKD